MTEQEIKKLLIKTIETFKEAYPEWEGFDILLTPENNKIRIETEENAEAINEVLRDFSVELKKNNLMLKSLKNDVEVVEYSYLVEDGLDALADEIELRLGKYISNLIVTEKDNEPYVRFTYIGSLTSDEKAKIQKEVKEITSQYEAIDEDDIFAEIEFDDFESVMQEIENGDEEQELESEPKAEDTDYEVNQDIVVTQENKALFEKAERELQKAIANKDKESAEKNYAILFKANFTDFQNKFAELDDLVDRLPKYRKEIDALEDFTEDQEKLYQIVVDNDAPVGYTKAELVEMLEPEQIRTLLAGGEIEILDDENNVLKAYLVL